MDLANAVELIAPGVKRATQPQLWIDLGAGQGLFTIALSSILGPSAQIIAVDRDASALKMIRGPREGASIRKQQTDFLESTTDLPPADGILMANALHFVRDKHAFVSGLRRILRPGAGWIIVEYDTDRSNPWVPYPISFLSLKQCRKQWQYQRISRLGSASSLHFKNGMYSAQLFF